MGYELSGIRFLLRGGKYLIIAFFCFGNESKRGVNFITQPVKPLEIGVKRGSVVMGTLGWMRDTA